MTEQQKGGLISKQNISKEIRSSFLDYSMSVIVSRALPDVRDGMKPVHRRILYAMQDLGNTADKPYKKSARIVGDVIGKYHPHGDAAVYGTMVRMAQDFSYRYPLVDGHGNFGSMDGDGAAAMRYTEARMSKITSELLRDINKDTVDFIPNYDETEKEPAVLPARFPNLLVNGSSGIAVGMATNIPPHQLGEVIDGIFALNKNPDITTEELMMHVKGPDFPTGALIMGKSGIRKAYETGRGLVIMRGRVEIEQRKNGRESIVITEIPYQVNKAKLVEKIADLARDKKIDGITDLRDESNLKGVRIVIDIRKDVNSNVLLNNLYKLTPLQSTFGMNMLALVNGRPQTLSLKEILIHYLAHQKDVVRRRTAFELRKAEARAHILEGLRIALDHIDAIITLIRSSKLAEEAKQALMRDYQLSERQAQAILDMRLQRLTGLERDKIEEEYQHLLIVIADLKDILSSDTRVLEIIEQELAEIKERYNDQRRSEITAGGIEFIDDEDLIEEEQIVITLSHGNYIKRLPSTTYRSQNRGGRGVQGMNTSNEDYVEHLITCSTHDHILFFTNKGRVYSVKGYEIHEMGRTSKGIPIINILEVDKDERINAMLAVSDLSQQNSYLVFATRKGIVKRSNLADYKNIRTNGKIALTLREDDELITVKQTTGDSHIILGTHKGYSIRFNEEALRVMGRTASGVKGISLRDEDIVIGMDLLQENQQVLIVTNKGYGKRSKEQQYRMQTRGGKGIKTAQLTTKNGYVVGLKVIDTTEDVMLITNQGVIIRMDVADISETGRSTQGVRLIKLNEEQFVSSVALAEKEPQVQDVDNVEE